MELLLGLVAKPTLTHCLALYVFCHVAYTVCNPEAFNLSPGYGMSPGYGTYQTLALPPCDM